MLVTHFLIKKAHFKELDAIKIDNLKNKTALNELRKKTFTDKGKGSFGELQNIIKDWNKLGQIPRGKEELEQQFQLVMDGFYKSLKITKKQLFELKFKNKLEDIKDNEFKLEKERNLSTIKFLKNKKKSLNTKII